MTEPHWCHAMLNTVIGDDETLRLILDLPEVRGKDGCVTKALFSLRFNNGPYASLHNNSHALP